MTLESGPGTGVDLLNLNAGSVLLTGSWELDADSGQSWMSAEMLRIFDFPPQTTVVTHTMFNGRLHPDDRDAVRDVVTSAARGESAYDCVYRIVLPTGEVRTIHAQAQLAPPRGGAVRLIGTAQEITGWQQQQARVMQADRMAQLGLLAASIAHEINNPLTAALHGAAAVAGGLTSGETGDLEELAAQARRVVKSIRQIREVVRGLQAFARVEADSLEQVQLNHSVRDAVRLCLNELRHRATLSLELGDLPTIRASRAALSQVVLNLLINAAQALKSDNPGVNAIRVRTWSEGDEVCVEVSDTGDGIPQEDLERIFEPFYTTKQAREGSGLGLAVCSKIVASFGGTIRAESGGPETRLVVRLPLVPAQDGPRDRPPQPPRVSPPAAAARGRVLVIDDEDDVAELMRRILMEHHEVVKCTTAAEARCAIDEDDAFDAVICDLMMPGESGSDLHVWIEQHHPALLGRLAFVTGGAFLPRPREFLTGLPNPRLEKPFEEEELLALVRRLLK